MVLLSVLVLVISPTKSEVQLKGSNLAYILGLVVGALLFLSMHYFTELDKKQKTTISLIMLGVILSAILYNNYSSKQRDIMMTVVTAYQQNKTVKCGDIDVNNKLYDLSIGTYTFIGKKDTPNYGQMISASSCK